MTSARPVTAPSIHRFDSAEIAYNASQCDDNIHDGDILIVNPVPARRSPISGRMIPATPGAVAILCGAWPIQISIGGEPAFHRVVSSWNWTCAGLYHGDPDLRDYTVSVRVAVREARELNLAIEPGAMALAPAAPVADPAAAPAARRSTSNN